MKKTKHFSCFYYAIFFAMPKNSKLNSTHYYIMKILNKQELQQIAFDYSPYIDFKDFMNLYKKGTAKSYSVFFSY